MTFTIVLTPDAENDLAVAWIASSDRPAVTTAAHQLEHKLAANPLAAGESRASSVNRVDYVLPLGFTFDVVVDDATVYVTAMWLIS
ncbi:MAG: hypothetical protein C0467_28050 [Planctomycetaceae bacterium]|nr:hypothetical protein [Planctomycetaceae bacterium]